MAHFMSEMKYEYAQATPDGKYWGLIDKSGKYVVSPEYVTIHQWKEGILCLVKKKSDVKLRDGKWTNYYNGEMYFINHKGEFIHSDPWGYGQDFSEGLAAVSLDGKWGFISKEGEVVIDFLFEMTYGFHEGLSATKYDNKWGFIDKSRHWVIEAVYDSVQSFKFGLAVVQKDDCYFIINYTADIIMQTPNGYPWLSIKSENIILYGTTSEEIGIRYYGFMDVNGNVLTDPEFYVESEYDFDLFNYSEGMLIVTNEEDQYGFLDEKGKLTIPCVYDSAEPFENGYAEVMLDDKKYAIDKNGERSELTEPEYAFDEVLSFNEGLAAAKKGDKWGFINSNGEVLIDFIYNDYPPHKEHLASGVYLAELFPKFSCGLLPIIRSDGDQYQSGFIDSSGKEVIPTQFLFVRNFESAI